MADVKEANKAGFDTTKNSFHEFFEHQIPFINRGNHDGI